MECCCCFNENATSLSCNHPVCIVCVKKIMKINSLCPICRGKFDTTPFKYVPPKRLNDLKITTSNKKMLNKYLGNRYLLTPCKKQRLYAYWLFRYTDQICFQNKYINLDGLMSGEIVYDPDYLIDALLWLNSNNKIYSYGTRQNVIYIIRSTLCNLWL
jgi:hypothetical protein